LPTLIIPFTLEVPSSLSFDTQFFESRVTPCVCYWYLKKEKIVLINKNKDDDSFLQLFYLYHYNSTEVMSIAFLT
jgi:hypothetical protein